MPYRFATDRRNYFDYAAGSVFYARPGQPAFPVRLASEIFQSCLALRPVTGPCTLYDPCCGGAYHLSTLAYLHGSDIGRIMASDIDTEMVTLAARNLSLLTPEGLSHRLAEIEAMLARFGKASHVEALASGRVLQQQLYELLRSHQVTTRVFQADATDTHSLCSQLQGITADIVLTDIPYGRHSQWQGLAASSSSGAAPVWLLLEALRCVLTPHSIVAIAADKSQQVAHERYLRLRKFQVGRRRITLLTPTCEVS